jgi:glycylpeptide N-tetradecanoyltransferase
LTPDYEKTWHVGLRATHNEKRKLCAFITGIPVTVRVRNNTFKSVEINFLCVHKNLRSKRLAPVLIKEITRRCHLLGIWEAVYTAGVVLPKPIATCRYYHRSLQWTKLYQTGFSPLPSGMTEARMVMRNRLPKNTFLPGIRLMEEADVKAVTTLLKNYLDHFDLAPEYTEDEVRHWLLHRGDDANRVIWAYVVEVFELHAAFFTNIIRTLQAKKLPISSLFTHFLRPFLTVSNMILSKRPTYFIMLYPFPGLLNLNFRNVSPPSCEML